MEFLIKHLQAATEIDKSALTLIVVMCGIALYAVRSQLVIQGLMVVLLPLNVTLSAMAMYGMTKLELFPLNKLDQWLICTISSATIGSVVGLGFAVLLAKLLEYITVSRKRVQRA